MLVSRQWVCSWLSYKPSGNLPLLTTKAAVTFQLQGITALRPVSDYTAWWVVTEAQWCK